MMSEWLTGVSKRQNLFHHALCGVIINIKSTAMKVPGCPNRCVPWVSGPVPSQFKKFGACVAFSVPVGLSTPSFKDTDAWITLLVPATQQLDTLSEPILSYRLDRTQFSQGTTDQSVSFSVPRNADSGLKPSTGKMLTPEEHL